MHAKLICTYRLQLSSRFTFRHAAEIVPYLSALGVSHCYLSPILQAAPGSDHGYDVLDPTRVSEDLGGEDGLEKLFVALRTAGMGAVIDIVPNHAAAVPENPWWWDVLKNGPASEHASAFDIFWNPPGSSGSGKVLLPVLADPLDEVISHGELTLSEEEDGPVICYHDQRFPVHGAISAAERGDLTALLDRQFYRLACWRVGADEGNYRRFFDIGTLVGVRVEEDTVFRATHGKLLELLEQGPIDGFRIDHPDGLRDPRGYFQRLREVVGPGRWLLAEKILEPGEALPKDWPVDGTTGYDFIQRAGGLFIEPTGEQLLTDFNAEFSGRSEPYGALVREKKRAIVARSFGSDLRRVASLLREILARPPFRLDQSAERLGALLTEVLAGFPVYRTYIDPESGYATPADRAAVHTAVEAARRDFEAGDVQLVDLVEQLLTGEFHDVPGAAEFVARFQQLTGPVMAKGVEDTTFYCYDRLLALNEVGCDPSHFGVCPDDFHQESTRAQRDWPRSMLASSTHDTKRSEDVRARISLISEMPAEWASQVRSWSEHNLYAWQGHPPDHQAEHVLYQSLFGTWPINRDRIAAYMEKACREAKVHTSWTEPNESYEAALQAFIASVMGDSDFRASMDAFVAPWVTPGRVNSLSQTLLKFTTPGVPDLYQGCELWDDSMVDPDNRRPVDYQRRAALLAELDAGVDAAEIMERADEGLPKLALIRTCIQLRRKYPAAFGGGLEGRYQPLLAVGERLAHVVAFSRGDQVAVVVPRRLRGVESGWLGTCVQLPHGDWSNVFDGSVHAGCVPVDQLFQNFPVALLERTNQP